MFQNEFVQTIFHGQMSVIGNQSRTELTTQAGVATQTPNTFQSVEITPERQILDSLLDKNVFFSHENQLKELSESLIKVSRRVNRDNNLELSAVFSYQTEHVSIRDCMSEVTDVRKWGSLRIAVSNSLGKIVWRDIPSVDLFSGIELCVSTSIQQLLSQFTGVHENDKMPETRECTVVFSPGVGGYFLHEVFGHMLEGDFVSNGLSVFGNRIKLGDKVAPSSFNLYDDPTGYLDYIGLNNVDDEGLPICKKTLVEGGVLSGFLCDRATADKLGDASFAGRARRQSYKFRSIPRMGFTYLSSDEGGPSELECIKDISDGVLCRQLLMGQVNPATGDFVLIGGECSRITSGEESHPIKNLHIQGNIVDALKQIDVIGNDFDFLHCHCGKANQNIPVCVGSPTLRVSNLTIRENNK